MCRDSRSITIEASRCLARAAEQLWQDVILDRPCQAHTVTTMYRCDKHDPQEPNVEEVCFLLTASEPPNRRAVVLEGVLLMGSGPITEPVATFVGLNCMPLELWHCIQGRPGTPNIDATTCFVQGARCAGRQSVQPDSGHCFYLCYGLLKRWQDAKQRLISVRLRGHLNGLIITFFCQFTIFLRIFHSA